MPRTRQRYPPEFNVEAVHVLGSGDRSLTRIPKTPVSRIKRSATRYERLHSHGGMRNALRMHVRNANSWPRYSCGSPVSASVPHEEVGSSAEPIVSTARGLCSTLRQCCLSRNGR